MFGYPLALSSFISPVFWMISGVGAYFLILAIAEKMGREIGPTGLISGITFSVGMFAYCVMKFF